MQGAQQIDSTQFTHAEKETPSPIAHEAKKGGPQQKDKINVLFLGDGKLGNRV